MKYWSVILGLVICLSASAEEVIPLTPKEHFNDYAQKVTAAVAERLNKELAEFERQTSNQVLVVIFAKMESELPIKDYTTKVFNAWKVGQKEKNNGVVLFVFVNDRKLRLATGTGMEQAMPDSLCKHIIDEEIGPHLKKGEFDDAMSAGVKAILEAARKAP